tara:strand:- start:257 stop:1183 length:927 start_codon:yes stop_codon:yes gene_type:complete
MIIIDRTNSNSSPTIEGQNIRVQGTVLPKITAPPREVCACDLQACEYENTVFADLLDADIYKNDKSSFLLRKYVASDSIAFTLIKDGEQIASITDDTYGTYYGSGVGSETDYRGLQIEWRNVLTLHGSGIYQIGFNTTIIGATSSTKSIKFYLLPYSDENADKTVVFKWVQNGSIRSSDFDYTGLDWEQQFRVSGKFWKESPTVEIDNYMNGNYEIEQIQDRITSEYELDLDPLPIEIGEPLIYDCLLGNSIEITDYNLDNYKQYENFRVQTVSVDSAEEKNGYNFKTFIVKFTKRQNNDIKNNYLNG